MTAVKIPPDSQAYDLGRINTLLVICDVGPSAEPTVYNLVFLDREHLQGVIRNGEGISYRPDNCVVYIVNRGPADLVAFFGEAAVTPGEAGVKAVDSLPSL